jgi:hypothetical protein
LDAEQGGTNRCVLKKNGLQTGGKLAKKMSYSKKDFSSEARGL